MGNSPQHYKRNKKDPAAAPGETRPPEEDDPYTKPGKRGVGIKTTGNVKLGRGSH